MIITYLYKNKKTIKLIFLLLVTLLIFFLLYFIFLKLFNKEEFQSGAPEISANGETLTQYVLQNPKIAQDMINGIKGNLKKRHKFWSFITPDQEFNGYALDISKLGGSSNDKYFVENKIYYKYKDASTNSNTVEFDDTDGNDEDIVVRFLGSIVINYVGESSDLLGKIENIIIKFKPKHHLFGSKEIKTENENENEIESHILTKLKDPSLYYKDLDTQEITELSIPLSGASKQLNGEILIVYNQNINLEIDTPSIKIEGVSNVSKINYVECYGSTREELINSLRYLDTISITLTKLLFINLSSKLLCFGNSGTNPTPVEECEIDENLSKLDYQSRIWIDSFEDEIIGEAGLSIEQVKKLLKQEIDANNSIVYLKGILSDFTENQ